MALVIVAACTVLFRKLYTVFKKESTRQDFKILKMVKSSTKLSRGAVELIQK